MSDQLTTEEVFESAVSIVRNLPKEGLIKPSDELKLKLYAYFKQATHGPNDSPKPRFYQIVDGYKWDAWAKLGNMSKEEAMSRYIAELKQIMDSIPRDATVDQDSKQFEDALGKKFYDYWFGHWSQSRADQEEAVAELTSSEEQTVTDQFAKAMLRLQHGLRETNSRLSTIESQVKQAKESVDALQTGISHPAMCIFYLSYPILIYFVMRSLERRIGSKAPAPT